MKHVFFVHSHITFLVSLGVINKEKIAKADTVFVIYRGYNLLDNSFIWIEFNINKEYFIGKNIFKKTYEKKRLRKLLSSVIEGEFIWYLPQTIFYFFEFLIKNSGCKGFSVIEEGMGSYYKKEVADAIINERKSLNMGGLLKRIKNKVSYRKYVQVVDDRYLFVYGFSELSFPGYKRRKIVDVVYMLEKSIWDEITVIIVFDAILESGNANAVTFYECLEYLILLLSKKGNSVVHYKLHPEQYINTSFSVDIKKTLHLNTYGIKFVEIPMSCSLEVLAMKGRAEFYIFCSSVGIYASHYGCNVYSLARRLSEIDDLFIRTYALIPDSIRKLYKFI